jgi:hypothetical protein
MPRNPDEIRASMKRKVTALPKSEAYEQDEFGYVSPYLRSLRDKPNKTEEDWNHLRAVQNRRADIVEFNIPARPQNQTNPTLAFRNNNPGNLGFARQEGATRGDGGFARFQTPEIGLRALEQQVRLDRERGMSLEEFAYKYAPAHENDTERYIQNLERATKLSRTSPLRYAQTRDIADAIARLESSTVVTRRGRP